MRPNGRRRRRNKSIAVNGVFAVTTAFAVGFGSRTQMTN